MKTMLFIHIGPACKKKGILFSLDFCVEELRKNLGMSKAEIKRLVKQKGITAELITV